MTKHPQLFLKLTILSLFATGFIYSTALAQMGGADVRYISDKSFFVLQFDMQKLYGYEKMGSKNLEDMAKFFKKESQLDIMSMKTLTIQFCEGKDSTEFGEDTFGLVMDFNKPVNKKGFLEGMGVGFEDDSINGVAYHRASEEYAPSICFPTDKTVVMAMGSTIGGMIGKKSADSKIKALLNSADPNAEVKGAFNSSEMYRTMLAQIASEIPISPFNIEKVFGQAETAVFSGSVKSSTPIHLLVDCKTEDGAKDLAKKGKLLVDLGKATIPLGRDSIKKQQKEFEGRELRGFEKYEAQQMKMATKGLDVSEKILEAAETSSKGKTAVLKVKRMEGARDLIPILAAMFATQFRAVDELQKAIPSEFEDVPDIDDVPIEIK